MANITDVKLPDSSQYDLKDNVSGYQTETLATPITINDTQETTVEGALGGLNDYGDALADNLAANENVLGAKNLGIPLEDMTYLNLSTSNNSDGSLTVTTNGLACGGVNANWSSPFILKKGTYQVSFGLDTDETPSLTGFAVILKVFSNSYWLCTSGDSVASRKITLAADTEVVWGLYCESGTVVATQTAYPMIRPASIVDPTFAPYAKTNQQLTDDAASIFDILPNNAGAHNRYRGKALTLDADFWARISDGSFENQFVGDTITINGRTYILAHANYWLHTGDTECTANHWVVISPVMGNAKMNSDNSTVGGYLGSGLRSGINHDSTPNTTFADAIATIKSDFGASHILSRREYLDNAITGGYPSSGTWVDSEAELMSQIMVYGNRFFDPSTNLGATMPTLETVSKTQLACFAQKTSLITVTNYNLWLRDVISSTEFAIANNRGTPSRISAASFALGVRLAFGIKA